jgi:hypothetical protein
LLKDGVEGLEALDDFDVLIRLHLLVLPVLAQDLPCSRHVAYVKYYCGCFVETPYDLQRLESFLLEVWRSVHVRNELHVDSRQR